MENEFDYLRQLKAKWLAEYAHFIMSELPALANGLGKSAIWKCSPRQRLVVGNVFLHYRVFEKEDIGRNISVVESENLVVSIDKDFYFDGLISNPEHGKLVLNVCWNEDGWKGDSFIVPGPWIDTLKGAFSELMAKEARKQAARDAANAAELKEQLMLDVDWVRNYNGIHINSIAMAGA